MTEQMYRVEITCVGEVRDADGNLISSSDVTLAVAELSESELRARGLTEE